MNKSRLKLLAYVTASALVCTFAATGAIGDGAHLGTSESLGTSVSVEQENLQRVIAHPIEFSLEVNGETFDFQTTIAEGQPAAMTVGNEGASYAYRLELLAKVEEKTPAGDKYLPLGVKIYLENPGSRTLLKDISMGLKEGSMGSMKMGSDNYLGSDDYLIVLNATALESEEVWFSTARIAQGSECFNSPPNVFDASGRLPALGIPGEDLGSITKKGRGPTTNASGEKPPTTEHAGVPPSCCHEHCNGTWFICCGGTSCCNSCKCCTVP